jgi:hypothetical protein
VFIAARFVMGVTGWETLGVEIVQAIIWACLAMALVFADISIHWREIRSALSGAPAKAPVTKPAVSRKLDKMSTGGPLPQKI